MYNGESTVNEIDCEDFLKILKKNMILIVKSTGKINKTLCSIYDHGFCKAGPGCLFNQPDVDSETRIRGKSCRD